jgi:pSer/pThr/pTyr-binding forkhead associated (FHA) protein
LIQVTIAAIGLDTEVHRVTADALTIGRGPTNDIALSGRGVSRTQARVYVVDGMLVLEDLGSTNGTFVNGVRLESPCYIEQIDAVDLGDYRVSFLLVDDAAPAAEPAPERTVAVSIPEEEPPRATPGPRAGGASLDDIPDEAKRTMSRQRLSDFPEAARVAAIVGIRRCLDELVLDAASEQFEAEVSSPSPPSTEALQLVLRLLERELALLD